MVNARDREHIAAASSARLAIHGFGNITDIPIFDRVQVIGNFLNYVNPSLDQRCRCDRCFHGKPVPVLPVI